MADRPLVVKFGGSCFTEPTDYGVIARRLAERARRGDRVCVVVSAMSGTTGRILELLKVAVREPDAASVDASLATAESLACALMRAAVVEAGVPVTSLNGHQLGWIASEAFTNSEVTDLTGCRLSASLDDAPIVVVAGGQAITRDGRIAMMGRNSSDLTAVLCAASLGSSSCTIVSDVEGVHTADPYLIEGTRLVPALGYGLAGHYATAGAKVLHPACVEAAERAGVQIECAAIHDGWFGEPGTVIGRHGRAVQVVVLKDVAVVETNELSALDRPGLIGSWGREGPGSFAGLTRHSPAWDAAESVGLTEREDLGAFVSFDAEGNRAVHVAPRPSLREAAQRRHDALVSQIELPMPRRVATKSRSAFSNVYSGRG